MISPEVLRRYPFFSFLDPSQLKEVAMISEEIEIGHKETLFHVGDDTDFLYLLKDGAIDLHYVVIDEYEPQLRKDFLVGHVNPGEIVGVSAIIEPHIHTATAIANGECQLLQINAPELRRLCEEDLKLQNDLLYRIAEAAIDKLHATRIQLAAARET